MAHWDGKQIVYMPTVPNKEYPAWDVIDCGCCAGIMWGGETPRECKRCDGFGVVHEHRKSKVSTALRPSGHFC